MSERDQPSRRSGGRPTGPQHDELAARRAEAWRLRVEEGRTYADIGLLMGCTATTAHNYVKAVLAQHAPSEAEVHEYRQNLVATAMTRAELAFERADELWEDGKAQELIIEGPRGGKIVSTLAPQLYGQAAAWERRGQHHLDRVARWSGVEALVAAEAGPDADALEGSIAAEAERFLAVMAEVNRKRDAAAEARGDAATS